jgi:hypothetical protein
MHINCIRCYNLSVGIENRSYRINRGNRFGKLRILSNKPTRVKSRKYWPCKCDCGNKTDVYEQHLLSGKITSCFCSRPTEKDALTYNSWRAMKARCYQSNHRQFYNYGGRGVKVCTRWHSFKYFLEDMGKRPGKEYSIDRIDGDGHYEPKNCKWATMKEQMSHSRRDWLNAPKVTAACP